MQHGPRSGQQFGPYDIRGMVGRGGMGEVYEAFDRRRGRTVALKLLPVNIAQDASFRARFEHEAAIAARLDAPHVIPIHDFGEIDGTYFIDMRLVRDGRNLRELLQQEGPLTLPRAAGMTSQIASALDAAHRDGLVHRDVKPENVLVTADDFVYLVDFGIARADGDQGFTQAGSAIGSLSYMAPERFEDVPDSPAGDIYALGCVFFHMLTGIPPFGSGTIGAMVRAHSVEPPPSLAQRDPRIPASVDPVLHTALNKNPAARQASAGEFAAQLQAAVNGAPAAVPDQPTALAPTNANAPTTLHRTGGMPAPVPTAEPGAMPKRRRAAPIVVGGLIGLLAAAGVLYGVHRAVASDDSGTAAAATTEAPVTGTPRGAASSGSPSSSSSSSSSVATESSYPTALPDDVDVCPGQPDNDQFGTVTGAIRRGQVNCGYAEKVYRAYQRAKGDDGRAEFKLFDNFYSGDDHPHGVDVTVGCSPRGGYVVCVWTMKGSRTPTGSKEYILRH